MRFRGWVVSVALASISWVTGCGSITLTDGGAAGSRGGDAAGAAGSGGSGSAGRAGTGGGAAGASGGSVGTQGSAGSAAGGRGGGNAGTAGAGGAAAGGRGGSDGTGAGGRGGNAGTMGPVGTGGVALGGRGGGGAGTSGTGTGGITTGGRGGGNAGTAGASGRGGGNAGTTGAGGAAAGGRGGGNAGTGGAAGCARGMCPALTIGDLEAIDDSKAPGFDAPGFRCKSLTICQNASACIYYSTDMLGSLQSADDVYNDGVELAPAPVKLSINIGSASQCNNPPITIGADEFLTLTFDGGKKVPVYLPASMGTTLTLYIASDGSTFLDAALMMPARLRP